MLEFSRGEIAVVVFVFLLVYGGLVMPRFGERVALRLAGKGKP
jgi:hypothetical protein